MYRVGQAEVRSEGCVQYTQMAASSVLSLLPAFVLLLLGQRHIVRGLLAGAIK